MSGTDRWRTADPVGTEFGVASAFTLGKTIPPMPIGATSIIQYTFGPGPLGFSLEEAQGGKRVTVNEVVDASQAHRMGVPVGGVLMKVGSRTATGQRRATVGKWLAAAERPLVIQIMHPGGAAAAQASMSAATSTDDDPFAVQYEAPQNAAERRYSHPAAKYRPIDTLTLDATSLGIKEMQETDEGVMVTAVIDGSAASTSGLSTGTIIIAINGEEAPMQKSAVSEQLRRALRPVTLTVVAAPERVVALAARRRPSDTPNAEGCASNGPTPYTFEQGPLGLTLEEVPGDTGGVMISHTSGAAEALGVPVGGLLVRINTEGVGNYTKNHVAKVIAKAARPLTLYIRLGPPRTAMAPAPAPVVTDVPAADAPQATDRKTSGTARGAIGGGAGSGDVGATSGDSTSRKAAAADGKRKNVKAGKVADGKTTKRADDKVAATNRRGGRTVRAVAVKVDRPADAWPAQPQREEGPPTRKFTFGPGSLGLGLTDVPGGKGGVLVSEVATGSAASEVGVEPGGMILALNGSDVTGHGKVSLGKMIGYLPRPLVMTISVPTPPEGDPADDKDGDNAAAATKKAKDDKSAKGKGKKSTRKPKASPRDGRERDEEKPRPVARPVEDAMADGADRDAIATATGESSSTDAKADGTADGGKATSAAPPSYDADAIAPPENEMEGEDEADDEADDLDAAEMEGEEAAPDASDEDEPMMSPTGDQSSPRGAADDSSAGRSPDAPASPSEPEKPTEPWRAHPPPQAPKEEFPAWAMRPPMRSPRHVAGADAKYVLKPTSEAFQHASLTRKAEPKEDQPVRSRRNSLAPGMAIGPPPTTDRVADGSSGAANNL